MMELMILIFKGVMESPCSRDDKLLCLCAISQVYGSVLGMTQSDFEDWTYYVGDSYTGPLPDGYSQELTAFYEGAKKHE